MNLDVYGNSLLKPCSTDLRKIFNYSLNKTTSLISDKIIHVEATGRRVRVSQTSFPTRYSSQLIASSTYSSRAALLSRSTFAARLKSLAVSDSAHEDE